MPADALPALPAQASWVLPRRQLRWARYLHVRANPSLEITLCGRVRPGFPVKDDFPDGYVVCLRCLVRAQAAWPNLYK